MCRTQSMDQMQHVSTYLSLWICLKRSSRNRSLGGQWPVRREGLPSSTAVMPGQALIKLMGAIWLSKAGKSS